MSFQVAKVLNMQYANINILFRIITTILVFFSNETLSAQETGVCATVLSQNQNVNIPRFDLGSYSFSASGQLVQDPSSKNFYLKLTSFDQTTRNDCLDSDLGIAIIPDKDTILHLPSIMINGKRYWANFKYIPTNDKILWLLLTQFGDGIDGVSHEGSAFLSIAQTIIQKSTNTELQFETNFPGDIKANVAISVANNQTYIPTNDEITANNKLNTQIYNVQINHSETEENFNYVLKYFVPKGVSPKNKVIDPKDNKSQSGSSVVVNGVVSSLGKKTLTTLIKKGFDSKDSRLDKFVTGGVKPVSTFVDVYSVWNKRKQYEAWKKRLDAAENCVNNPSNSLMATGTKEKLATIAEARSELNVNEAAAISMMVLKSAAGFISEMPLIGSLVISGGKSYTVDALDQISEQIVHEVEALVGQCSISWDVTFNGNGTWDSKWTGLSYTNKKLRRKSETAIFQFSYNNDQVNFLDNGPLGQESPNYNRNHADVKGTNTIKVTGIYSSELHDDASNYHKICSGEITNSYYNPDIIINDIYPDNGIYPPIPEFNALIKTGINAIQWKGNCSTNGITNQTQSYVYFNRDGVHWNFDFPKDFRSGIAPIEVDNGDTDTVSSIPGADPSYTTKFKYTGTITLDKL